MTCQRRVVLGSHCGQCCGGVVTSTIAASREADSDWIAAQDAPATVSVTIFGAGHVGRAVAGVLAAADARVLVVDSRPALLATEWPVGVRALLAHTPVDAVAHIEPAAEVLVMTHDHDLDFALCDALLRRADLSFIGLIGSRTKARRFDKRLAAAGHDDGARNRLVCPIGLPGLGGKHPGEIAISVAAQLLGRRDAATGHADAPAAHAAFASIG